MTTEEQIQILFKALDHAEWNLKLFKQEFLNYLDQSQIISDPKPKRKKKQ